MEWNLEQNYRRVCWWVSEADVLTCGSKSSIYPCNLIPVPNRTEEDPFITGVQ